MLKAMNAGRNPLLADLENIVIAARRSPGCTSASRGTHTELLPTTVGSGLYDVDHAAGLVRNVTWSGPGAPEHPTFPLTKGLTSAAVAQKQIVNVGDVLADARYLTAFGSTRSEIIVPVFDEEGKSVVGTIDVESEEPNAFNKDVQDLLEACSVVIRPLWKF